ncbi:MAG: hypothetical protein V7K88_12435 [Nostoc sp.]|uniref:hypothetical protein n=1 Tax=Nostoc sp. TaxID=1180 RepID=UPI002FF971E8
MSAKMTDNSLYSPNFGEFLDNYPKKVKEIMFKHPKNNDPKKLIEAIVKPRGIKLGIQEKDFILAIYQYQYVQICSGNLDTNHLYSFKESYKKHPDLPSLEIFRQATRDDFILTSLKKFFNGNETLITDIYKKLSKTS